MPRPTNTERIDQISQETARIDVFAKERIRSIESELKRSQDENTRLREIVGTQSQRLAAVEQRCISLEQQSGRTWQVWLAVLAAALAVIVSFIKR